MPLPEAGPDPHGALAWLNAIFETLKQAYAGLLVPTGFAIAWIVNKRGASRDKAQERADALRHSEEEKHRRAEEQLDKDSADYVAGLRSEAERLRAETARLQAEVGRLQQEVNRLITLIRRWYDKAHDMRNEAGRVLQRAIGAMERDGITPPEMTLPDLSYDMEDP